MGAITHSILTRSTVLCALVGATLPPSIGAQIATHAASGEFRPPTPAQHHRQDPGRNNLVHPEGYVTAPAGALGQVTIRGDGDTPVILVAGLGFGWTLFEDLMAAHAADYRFYAVSLAGYGGSSAPPMPPEGTSYGERTWLAGAQRGLGALIDEEALDRPIVVGFYSDAANVVAHLAAEMPDRIGGALLISAAARFPLQNAAADRAESLDRFADQWFKTVTEIMWPSGMFTPDYYAASPDVAERAWWEVLEPSLPTAIRYLVETWADDLVPLLPNLAVPTVVLSPGFDDEFMSGANGDLVRSRFHAGWDAAIEAGAGIDHRIVPGSRFLIWEDRPEAVADALMDLAGRR